MWATADRTGIDCGWRGRYVVAGARTLNGGGGSRGKNEASREGTDTTTPWPKSAG